jgi:hypothetical protein
MGRLYARQAWGALGQVMASSQLLPTTDLQSGVLRSMFCAPPDGAPRPLGSPMAGPLGAASQHARGPSRGGSPHQSPRAGADAAPGDSPTAVSAAGTPLSATAAGAAAGWGQAAGGPAAVKVGDRIFLGTRQRLRGAIRYVGPVHWDGDDWVRAYLPALPACLPACLPAQRLLQAPAAHCRRPSCPEQRTLRLPCLPLLASPCPAACRRQVGIELDSPQGTCNGTIQGVAYFAAPDKFGVFVALRSMQPTMVPGSPTRSPKLLVATPGVHPKEKQ